jgi:hypothetical protein
MAIFYWKGNDDSGPEAWNNQYNWFKDEALTVDSYAFPSGSTDIAVIPASGSQANISTLGANRTIAAFIDLNNGTYHFEAVDFTLTVGSASFLGASSNSAGKITGGCTFNGVGSKNNTGGTVTGGCIFTGTTSATRNVGTIIGGCIFSGDSSRQQGTITGDCLFSGNSTRQLSGTITGNCIFSETLARNSGGTITGDCIFNSTGTNSGTVVGTCVFSGTSTGNSGGTITGNAIFHTGTGMDNSGTISGVLVPLVRITNTGTAGSLPIDALIAGI